MAGIVRRRAGKHFSYRAPDGTNVKDIETLRRIRSLVIPPAWHDVWICVDPLGHIQAVGRDAKGRKQYRYHTSWRELRDETKFGRMLEFGGALPSIRAVMARDLALPGLPKAKVLAAIVKLLETTRIRVGNEEYARQNHSYGLTTLRDRHVQIDGSTMRFRFRGKSGKEHEVSVTDRRLARIVRACQDLPGQELFQYLAEDGSRQSVGSADVNAWLREASGKDFTAKDYRTWAGTRMALEALRGVGPADTQTHSKKAMQEAVKQVAQALGNTPAVCRRCYVHPIVFEAYASGTLFQIADPQDGTVEVGEFLVLMLLGRGLSPVVTLAAALEASLRARA